VSNQTLTARLALVLAVVVALVGAGCAHHAAVTAPSPNRSEAAPAPSQGATVVQPEPTIAPATLPAGGMTSSDLPATVDAINKAGYLKDAYFDTSKADLRADSRDSLASDAGWLKRHPAVKIEIEGHCDERNTEAYNLALGWRRCNAAKDYLVSMGVPAPEITTISYGKERPFATCHDESCWWQNRRDHFLVTARQ